jgi:hypothetical protein
LLVPSSTEKMQMEREYTAEEVADLAAFALDGQFSELLDARVTAEVDGDKVMLMVYPFDEASGETSPKGQVFTITVTDGYAMTLDMENEDDDFSSWGERF